ncbi:unnamed protein product [Rotaria sp. Silwood2]|nr:unnamed protein product [Rotaria sp. Silwood2]
MFVLLLKENAIPVVQNDPSSSDQRRRSFSTVISRISRKPSFIGHHTDSSDEENDNEKTTKLTNEIEDESTDLSGKDIDYSVLYDDTIEDYSFDLDVFSSERATSGKYIQKKKALL